jgi:phosphoribosylformylglycinamidine synthase subunit PurSL
VTMDAKRAGNVLVVVGKTADEMGGSHWQRLGPESSGLSPESLRVPRTDLVEGPRTAAAVAEVMRQGLAAAAHDVSDGGLLVALAEMLIAADGRLGATVDLSGVHADPMAAAFSESPSRYVLEVAEADMTRVRAALREIPFTELGRLDDSGRLRWRSASVDEPIDRLARAWLSPLDW